MIVELDLVLAFGAGFALASAPSFLAKRGQKPAPKKPARKKLATRSYRVVPVRVGGSVAEHFDSAGMAWMLKPGGASGLSRAHLPGSEEDYICDHTEALERIRLHAVLTGQPVPMVACERGAGE